MRTAIDLFTVMAGFWSIALACSAIASAGGLPWLVITALISLAISMYLASKLNPHDSEKSA